MLWVIGSGLWLVAVAAAARLAGMAFHGRSWGGRAVAMALVAVGAVLFFRPHEAILGGEDPGSYLNTGVAYAREGALTYVDRMLSRVPPAVRPDFLYGHSGFGVTKDGCVWIHDLKQAIVGVHFLPAYPLMMSAVSRLGPDRLILYVAPLFALLTALAVAALARQVISHRWAAELSFLFYIANPIVIWHGRFPRPELMASFLAIGGGALLIRAAGLAAGRARGDLILGALCVALAPFFHITAWMLVIPAAAAMGVLTLRGRTGFAGGLAVLATGVVGFVLHTLHVTDLYGIRRFMAPATDHPVTALAAVIVVLAATTGAGEWRRRAMHRRSAAQADARPAVWIAVWPWVLAVALVAAYAACFLSTLPVDRRPPVGSPTYHYAYPTDMRVVVALVSRPIAFLSLAGVLALLVSARPGRQAAALVVLVTAPATLLIGTMYDFFMTRYMLVSVLPLMALGLAGLLTRIPASGMGLRALLAALTAGVCLVGLHGRTHLVTLVENRGLIRFLGGLAEPIRARNGILLCEYSRVGAPLEHYFGIPTLGLDSDRRRDYRRALVAWRDIVGQHPDRPAFFLTPFQIPMSELFDFQPVQAVQFRGRVLKSERFALPRQTRPSELNLALYEMRKPGPPSAGATAGGVWSYVFGAGNMGLVDFANLRLESAGVAGTRVGPGTPVPTGSPGSESGLIFLNREGERPPDPRVTAADGSPVPDLRWSALGDSFRLASGGAGGEGPWRVVSERPALLTAVVGDARVEASAAEPRDMWKIGVRARWSRAVSRALLPLQQGVPCRVLLFFTAPNVPGTNETRVTLEPDGGGAVTRTVPRGTWMWECWPMAVTNDGPAWRWVTIRTEPAWRSGVRGFPDDLGVLVGGMAVWRPPAADTEER